MVFSGICLGVSVLVVVLLIIVVIVVVVVVVVVAVAACEGGVSVHVRYDVSKSFIRPLAVDRQHRQLTQILLQLLL